MSRRTRSLLATAGALAALAAAAPAAPAGETVAAIELDAAPGAQATVAAAIGRSGLRVHRRLGTRFQVAADRRRLAALRRLPGVAAARVAAGAVPDQARPVLSQGLQRTGADRLDEAARGGRGLVIAILDLGFGTGIEALQAAGELPPPARLRTFSFDPIAGLAGANAYGNRTNHGELVAQTVYDYAPLARYLFVNYRTEADFVAATDWLTGQQPDIVVHSNNFIEGRFDGGGPLAQAVDRAAGNDILWFNSTGNYARQHWSGPWRDDDGDASHDWADPAWTFTRDAGLPITFALSWGQGEPSDPTDLELLLDRRRGDGEWVTVAASRDDQRAGARATERLTGWRSPVAGEFRVRVVHRAGPPPSAGLTLFSREIPLAAAGGSPSGSVPTPADAAGAIAVGAVDWRGDRLRNYSSNGPTPDGRLKPDLTAPTDTRLMGPAGVRGVGGTSNAAPNAAGAAAMLLAAQRNAGHYPSAADLRAELAGLALDLGAPGPDPQFGAGRVRVSLAAAPIRPLAPRPGTPVRGVIRPRFGVGGAPLAWWSLAVDQTVLRSQYSRVPLAARLDTRTLPDGIHTLRAHVRDMPGNEARRAWRFQIDNTPPVVRRALVAVGRPLAGARSRPVRLRLLATDPRNTGSLRLVVRALPVRAGAGPPVVRTQSVRSGRPITIALGQLTRGRHRITVAVTDRAGNRTIVNRTAVVR